LPDASPWCGECEWNLDDFPSDSRFSWFWQRIRSSDQKAGFRSDLELAREAEPSAVGPRAFAFLVGLSAGIMLLTSIRQRVLIPSRPFRLDRFVPRW